MIIPWFNADGEGVADLLSKHYPVSGVVKPLADLAKQNPILTENIIELAVAYGLLAAYKKMQVEPKLEAVRELMNEASRRLGYVG